MSNNFYPEAGSTLNNQYRVVDVRGIGVSAIVLDCIDLHTSRKIAVKRFFQDKLTKNLKKKAIEETGLNIKSDYLAIAYGHFCDGYLNTIMPLIEGETLSDVLGTPNGIDLASAIYVSLCLARAAGDLHNKGILSTDIKPENIIIQPNGLVVLVDLACFERIGKKADLSMGTVPYAPPELLMRDTLYADTDIYSIGVVLSETLVGSEEFTKMSGSWDLATKRGIKPDISFLRRTHPELAEIIDKAIEPNPKKRHDSAYKLYTELLPYYNSLIGNTRGKNELRLMYEQVKEIILPQGRTVLGRDKIDKTNLIISEDHFEIDFDGSGIAKIRDANSTNGTYVNGEWVGNEWVQIHNTDIIQIIDSQIVVRISQ